MLATTKERPSSLLKRGWVRGRRFGKRLTLVAERVGPGTLNRIATFLWQNPRAGRTATLVFLRPRRARMTWPTMALARTRYSDRCKSTIDELKRDVRGILPECEPRTGHLRSPFFEGPRAWLERHNYFRSEEDYEFLGADGGIVHDAVTTDLPPGFRFMGFPTVTKRLGAIIRLLCTRGLSWRTFFERLDSYIRSFGHGNAIEEALVERDFIRVPFMTAGLHGMPCVHCGELQVEGPGVRKVIRDHRRSKGSWPRWR